MRIKKYKVQGELQIYKINNEGSKNYLYLTNFSYKN